MLTARSIFVGLAFDLRVKTWTAQDYDGFLETYDYAALEVTPYTEEVEDPKD